MMGEEMMPSNGETMTGWRALLGEPQGPGGRYDSVLEPLRRHASGAAMNERLLLGTDDALAAIAVLRGPGAARPVAEAAAPVVSWTNRKLTLAASMAGALSSLSLLSFVSVGETTGATHPGLTFNADTVFDRLLVDKGLPTPDRITLAFLSLDRGRPRDVRSIVSQGPVSKSAADPIVLIKTLAQALDTRTPSPTLDSAWSGFVRSFPSALAVETVEWRHLVLAARIVLAKLGSVNVGEVAQTLHQQVTALAAEETA
jgi:hypothetical protein